MPPSVIGPESEGLVIDDDGAVLAVVVAVVAVVEPVLPSVEETSG